MMAINDRPVGVEAAPSLRERFMTGATNFLQGMSQQMREANEARTMGHPSFMPDASTTREHPAAPMQPLQTSFPTMQQVSDAVSTVDSHVVTPGGNLMTGADLLTHTTSSSSVLWENRGGTRVTVGDLSTGIRGTQAFNVLGRLFGVGGVLTSANEFGRTVTSPDTSADERVFSGIKVGMAMGGLLTGPIGGVLLTGATMGVDHLQGLAAQERRGEGTPLTDLGQHLERALERSMDPDQLS